MSAAVQRKGRTALYRLPVFASSAPSRSSRRFIVLSVLLLFNPFLDLRDFGSCDGGAWVGGGGGQPLCNLGNYSHGMKQLRRLVAQDTECSYRDGYRTGRLSGQLDLRTFSLMFVKTVSGNFHIWIQVKAVCECVCVWRGGGGLVCAHAAIHPKRLERLVIANVTPSPHAAANTPGPSPTHQMASPHYRHGGGARPVCALARLITASTSTEAAALSASGQGQHSARTVED